MRWTAFLIFRLVFPDRLMVWQLMDSIHASLAVKYSKQNHCSEQWKSHVRKQDPCRVPRKSSGPPPAPSPKQSTACPGAGASGSLRPQLTLPDPVETRLPGVVISPLYPSPEPVSETQISRQECRKWLSEGVGGWWVSATKVLLLCQQTLSSKGKWLDYLFRAILFYALK